MYYGSSCSQRIITKIVGECLTLCHHQSKSLRLGHGNLFQYSCSGYSCTLSVLVSNPLTTIKPQFYILTNNINILKADSPDCCLPTPAPSLCFFTVVWLSSPGTRLRLILPFNWIRLHSCSFTVPPLIQMSAWCMIPSHSLCRHHPSAAIFHF